MGFADPSAGRDEGWFITSDQVLRLVDGSWQTARMAIAEAITLRAVGGGAGSVWVLSAEGSLLHQEEPGVFHAVPADALPALGRQSGLTVDRTGQLWILTGAAVVVSSAPRARPVTWQPVRAPAPLGRLVSAGSSVWGLGSGATLLRCPAADQQAHDPLVFDSITDVAEGPIREAIACRGDELLTYDETAARWLVVDSGFEGEELRAVTGTPSRVWVATARRLLTSPRDRMGQGRSAWVTSEPIEGPVRQLIAVGERLVFLTETGGLFEAGLTD